MPPDTNCLLSCFDHIIKTKQYINVIVASKHPTPQWLSIDEAEEHCTKGLDKWDWASNDNGNPDIVLACAGDAPTLEILAATTIIKEHIPSLKVRVVNVVDLMKLESNHPHGISDDEYDLLFTKDKPIIFAFHGYPSLIHQLTYKRHNRNLHVAGYIEEGTITTSFDMKVQNKVDRYHLVIKALKYLDIDAKELVDYCYKKLEEHSNYIREYGVDMPDVVDWKWEK